MNERQSGLAPRGSEVCVGVSSGALSRVAGEWRCCVCVGEGGELLVC